MSEQKQSQNGNEVMQQGAEVPEFAREVEMNFENLKEKPKEALADFAEAKVDSAVTNWMNKVSETFGKFIPESVKNIINSITEFFGIKGWFGNAIEKIKNWGLIIMGWILKIDFLKNGIEKGGDFINQGKELFFSFLEGLSFGPVKDQIKPIREFVDTINFKNITRVFTNPKEVLSEIKKQVWEKFPEVGYYFAINESEKITEPEKKVDAKQKALFDFSIGHFSSMENIKPTLINQFKELKIKVEKDGYESLTEDDWDNLENKLEENNYELEELNGLYYFKEQKGGKDMFILGYIPWQTIEELSKIEVNKLAISNVHYLGLQEGKDKVKEILIPWIPENVKEHLANHELTSSLSWYFELLDKLSENGIWHIITAGWLSLYNGVSEYTIEGLWVTWNTVWNILNIRSREDGWDTANEYLNDVTPLIVMGGAIGWGKAIMMLPTRISGDIIKGNFWFLNTISKSIVDVTKGVTIYGLGAPIIVPLKIKDAVVTGFKGKKIAKHIPKTIKVNLESLSHSLKRPLRAGQKLTGFRHKEELLYEDLLHYKKLQEYYSERKNDDIFKKSAQTELDHIRKEIGDIEDKIKKRGSKLHLEQHQKLLNHKIQEYRWKPEIDVAFKKYQSKHWLENIKDVFSLKKDWLAQKALEELRQEWKIGATKELTAYGKYLEESMQSKINGIKNFWKRTKALYGKTMSWEIFKEGYAKGKEKIQETGESIKKKTAIVHENNVAKPEQKQTFSERSKETNIEVNKNLDKLWTEADTAYKSLVEDTANGDQTKIESAKQAVDNVQNKIKTNIKSYKDSHLEAFKTRPIGSFTKVTMKGATTLFVWLEAARIVELFRSGEKQSAVKDWLDLTARLAPITGTYLDGKDTVNYIKQWEIKEALISGAFTVVGGISDVLLFTGIGTAFGAGGRAGLVSLKAGKMAIKGKRAANVMGVSRKAKTGIETTIDATKTGIKTTRKFLTAKKAAALAVGPLALYLMSQIEPTEEEIK